MYHKLTAVQLPTEQHHALCQWAYEYSKSTDFRYLNEKCSSEPKVPLYHQIRHYIGRLGSWHRAASVLVLAAVEIPKLVTGLDIELVPSQLTTWRPADKVDSLRSLIEKLNLDLNTDHALQKLQVFYEEASQSRKGLVGDLAQALTAYLTDRNFRPKVHAEVLLTDYVYSGQLQFVMDDRYIGVSKPACVLCRLYLEAHPAQVVSPSCHGNLWPQWSPPLLISEDANKHVDALIENMTLRLRSLLWSRLIYGRTGSSRLPDSMTGITSRAKSETFITREKMDVLA